MFYLDELLENNYEKTNFSRYFQKTTLRPRIDLGNKSRKIWVKIGEFKYLVPLHA